MAKDMTKGSPAGLILTFAVPVFLGSCFQFLYNIIDMAIVGRFVGVEALSAIGAVGSLMFCLTGAITGITSGFSIWISYYYGAGDPDEFRRYSACSIFLGILISLLLTAGGLWGLKGILSILNTGADIFPISQRYMQIVIGGTLVSMAFNLLSAFIRSMGDSKTPLYFLLASSFLNILLDLAAVCILHMGVSGAALATILSQLFSASCCFLFIKKRCPVLHLSKKDFRPDKEACGKLLSLGIPMALQFSVCSIGSMMVQSAINSLGSTVVAAYAIAGKFASFVELPYVSIGSALATYTGQNYGAHDKKRICAGVRAGLAESLVCCALMFLLSYTAAGPAAKLFLSDPSPEILSYVARYFRLVAWFYPFLTIIFVFRNTLQGIGDGFVPMLASVMELIGRASVILIIGTSLGFQGVILANPIAWAAACIPLVPVFYYRMHRF